MAVGNRTENSARNSTVALISQMIHLMMGFLLRIVFTHILSKDYVGVNGLFLDIIFILSLSELGVGTAITYALYRPIEERDIEKQKSLMLLFRKFYHLVALVVLGLGLLLIPFMDMIIKDPPNVEHLTVIYLFYLASAFCSYLMIYKRTLMDAHQLAYIGTLYNTISWVIQDAIQILVLVFTRNFLLYLSVNVVATIITNILISRKADRLYPFLKEKNVLPLSKEETLEIRKNVGAMFLHKFSNVVVNNTDNLLISAFVGIVSVGKYSNYSLVTLSLRNIVRNFFQGIMASVGNLGVSKDKERLGHIFHATLFINQWVSCFATIMLFEIFDLFVAIFFGEQYVFEPAVTALICVNFYLGSMREGVLVFRDSLGVFWYDRYKAVAEALINLVVSIILAQFYGTAGVFLGTVISTLTTSAWVEPYMLYKHRLHMSWREFWKRMLCYVPVTVVILAVTHWVCSLYQSSRIATLGYRALICLVVPNVLLLLVYGRCNEMRFLWAKGLHLLELRQKRSQLNASQRDFLQILKSNLTETDCCKDITLTDDHMEELLCMANAQSLMTNVYGYFHQYHEEDTPLVFKERMKRQSKKVFYTNYCLWQQMLHLNRLLSEQHVPYVLLKGPSVGQYYKYPEMRKSGDVDIWVYQPMTSANEGEAYYGGNFDVVERILLQDGYTREALQHGNHHVGFCKPGVGEVEVHVLWIEDFQEQAVNADIARLAEQAYGRLQQMELVGEETLPVLSHGDQACHMLLHMLQHYVTQGFGWKFLCDWTAFWNRMQETGVYDIFLEKVSDWHLETFVTQVTWICVDYLGLSEEAARPLLLVPVDYRICVELMKEMFASGEFGEAEAGRMVVPEGRGLWAMMREFHHQMRRNHYEASKQVWRWPYLWVITLIEFIANNHRIRNVSTGTVLANARRRSRLRKKMRLFKE